jgi:hypothetical protein
MEPSLAVHSLPPTYHAKSICIDYLFVHVAAASGHIPFLTCPSMRNLLCSEVQSAVLGMWYIRGDDGPTEHSKVQQGC